MNKTILRQMMTRSKAMVKVAKENKKRSLFEDQIKKLYKSAMEMRGARAKAIRKFQGRSTQDIVNSGRTPKYFSNTSGLTRFEKGIASRETCLFWVAQRLGIHPAMLFIRRPNWDPEYDGLLNRIIRLFEQPKIVSPDEQRLIEYIEKNVADLEKYRDENRAAAGQDMIPKEAVDKIVAEMKKEFNAKVDAIVKNFGKV